MNKSDNISAALAVALAALGIAVWHQVIFSGPPAEAKIVFFDIGQGDATMAFLPGGVEILTDAGPDRSIVREIQKSGAGRYIDIAIISHPQLDHFNGFNYLLDSYDFGAFIWNGRSVDSEEWRVLMDKISRKKIPLITVGEGDTIRYGENTVKILSPGGALLQSAELNDTSIVELVEAPPLKALLTGDIGFSAENYLIAKNYRIAADILKTAHHGSKYSSSEKFLAAVGPRVAVIEVGSRNRYGHPSREAVSRLTATHAKIFKTSENGTVEAVIKEGKLLIFTER